MSVCSCSVEVSAFEVRVDLIGLGRFPSPLGDAFVLPGSFDPFGNGFACHSARSDARRLLLNLRNEARHGALSARRLDLRLTKLRAVNHPHAEHERNLWRFCGDFWKSDPLLLQALRFCDRKGRCEFQIVRPTENAPNGAKMPNARGFYREIERLECRSEVIHSAPPAVILAERSYGASYVFLQMPIVNPSEPER